MGHGPDVACRMIAPATLVRAYQPTLGSVRVQNQRICTQTERYVAHHGPMKLDLRDTTGSVWAMGPLAHARNVDSRPDHYRATNRGAAPRFQ